MGGLHPVTAAHILWTLNQSAKMQGKNARLAGHLTADAHIFFTGVLHGGGGDMPGCLVLQPCGLVFSNAMVWLAGAVAATTLPRQLYHRWPAVMAA
jgi:hypothetical protein